ncbi:MAG: tRNA lysidine(34) synthetase TilS [Prevotella sp.]
MLDRIADYIASHALLHKDCLHLVALSGGADSVALLLALHRLGYTTEAVHCNFHLRGEESDRDESFVKDLCNTLGIKLHIAHFDTVTYSECHRMSIELAARNLRYDYFERLRKDVGAASICVAHHIDDQVETVLMNIVRGTRLQGLVGMKPISGNIVRPLLCVTRQEIIGFLDKEHQTYVTDSTNLEDDATRNMFRHHVVPLLKTINPNVNQGILRLSEYMGNVSAIYRQCVEDKLSQLCLHQEGGIVINLSRLLQERHWDQLLFEFLIDKGFNHTQIEQCIHSVLQTDKNVRSEKSATTKTFLSSDCELYVERDTIALYPILPHFNDYRLPDTGTYQLQDGKKVNLEYKEKTYDFIIPKQRDFACLDASSIRFPLVLRRVKDGDRFMPFGMNRYKLVNSYLRDRKVSLYRKRCQLVLEDGNGNILWLVNERIDQHYRISESTKWMLVVRWI